MINTLPAVSVDNTYFEPFEDRIDILFRELELATKWQRPSVLLAVYSSEYIRADADIALENRLHNLGQSAYHIKIKNSESADVPVQISELTNLEDVVFFVEGLRWGAGQDACQAYQTLNNQRDFFIENRIRVVFWLTEKEAIDLAHYAPDYWAFRHRVIEFVDTPNPDQLSPDPLESARQGGEEITDSTDDLDAKIALRSALLSDLPAGNESTSARANLLLTLGILHWRRGDFEKATQLLNNALDLGTRLEDNTFEALCFNAIALVQTSLGRTEEAIQAYQNAIELAPEQISPWNNLGHLYMKRGQRDQAIAAFQKALEKNGSDAVSWNGLGDLYHEAGHNADAIYAYMKAVEFSPEFAQSWCGLGNCQMAEGSYDEALTAYQKAIGIDRSGVTSWLGLGNIYRMQGKNENATMAYQTALEMDPRNAYAWNELGHLFYENGAFDEAMRSYQKSIEFNQDCNLTYGNLALIYIDKGLHAEAVPLLLKELELSEDKTNAANLWNQLGEVYQHLDDRDKAEEAFQKAELFTDGTSSQEVISSESEPDIQIVSSDDPDIEAQQDMEDMADALERHLPIEFSSSPIGISSKDDFETSGSDTDSSQPDEFVSWLEGLASVLPVTPEADQWAEDASSPFGETRGTFSEYRIISDTLQPDSSEGTSSPEEYETYYSSEPIPEFPGAAFFSDEHSEVQESDTPIQSQETVMLDDQTESSSTFADPESYEQDDETSWDETPSPIDENVSEDESEAQGAIDGKNAQIWNELGNIYYNTGAFEEAMNAFEMAIKLDPSCGWSYNNLASIHVRQKRYADAVPLYQKGLKFLDNLKDKALLWNRLGDAYRRMNKQDKAVAAYRKAVELDPDNVSLLTRARFSLLGNLRV